MNVFADEWEDLYPQMEGWRSNVRRLVPPGNTLGMSVYELLPHQTQCPYHFHHGNEELVLVVQGRPTLRTPDGERELEPGDVVHFPTGASGAHNVVNRTDEPVRYVVADTKVTLPRGAGTRTPEQVAAAVLRAIREDPAEITVAAFEQSVGALLAGISHPLVASVQRMLGGATIAKQIAAAQAHKR